MPSLYALAPHPSPLPTGGEGGGEGIRLIRCHLIHSFIMLLNIRVGVNPDPSFGGFLEFA